MTMANSVDMMKMEETSDHSWNSDRIPRAENSDVEQHSARGSSASTCDADYWFGRKYFDCTLAQHIFMRMDNTTAYPSIDAEFEKAVRGFPYATASSSFLASLPPGPRFRNLPGTEDSYRRLMTLTGMAIRICTTQEKRNLIDILRKACSAGSGLSDSDETLSPDHFVDHSPRVEITQPDRSLSPQTDTKTSLASFTSALNERAGREGIVLDYHTDRDPENMELYKCILSYQGCTFKGLGTSKPVAKHLASREAYNFLQGQQEHTI